MTPQSPREALQPEAPPPPPSKPPSRRRPTLSALSGFFSFLVIIAFVGLGAVIWGTNHLNEPGPLPSDKVVLIAPHTDLPDIVEKLNAEGVIDSQLALQVALTVERKRSKVKAGEYLFKQHASLRSVVDTLVSGKQMLHGITIPEGLTSQQIVQRLRDNDLLVGEVREVPKEGTLLPETYKVARGMTRNDLLQKMQDDENRVVKQIWSRRSPDLPIRSPYELVTLASIVEKETGKADERPRVAGVFINRLQRRMRLQSDPTIVYGLVGGQGTLGHSITRSELDKKTPYNTYQIDGLPPGPIDNPGRAALEAVANPSRTSDLYFVADGTGGHAFADSVDQHNRNVQRWRQIERDNKTDIDKVSPSAIVPPAKPNQRSDASDAVFGVLPTSIDGLSRGRVASFMDPKISHDIDKIDAAAEASKDARHPARGRGDLASLASGVDASNFTLSGSEPMAHDVLDGPVSEAAQQGSAFERTRPAPGAKVGASVQQVAKTSLDASPSDRGGDLFADPDGNAAAVVPMKTPPLHPKIYDASEGTALDPLRNKSYDLNTAKTIPADFTR